MGRRSKSQEEVIDKSGLFGMFRHHRPKEASRPSEEAVKMASDLIFTEQDYAETKCGLGSFTPQWLQVLARKEAYLTVFCLISLIQGMFFSYTVAIISTLEKRFKLTSKQTGAILAGNDVSQIIFAMFLAYFGNYGHRPRWVGVGVMFAAVSCFLAALPHVLYGPGHDALALLYNTKEDTRGGFFGNISQETKRRELCHNGPEDSCGGETLTAQTFGGTMDESGSGGGAGSAGRGTAYVGPLVLIFFSQFFVGISTSLFNSIGVTYLDDNVNRKSYALYFCVIVLLRIVGPVLGYLVGGLCLTLWIDPYQTPSLNPNDPRWLGAWWLGFVYLGCGLTLVGSLLFLFPRRLPATLKREAKRVVRQTEKEKTQEAAGGEAGGEVGGETEDVLGEVLRGGHSLEYFATLAKLKREVDKPTLSNLRAALGRLFTNPLWMGNLLNTVAVIFAFSGYMTFKPKYLEYQFRRSAAEANYYTGVVSLTSVLMGTALGGFILRWGRPRARYVAAYNILMSLFLCACYTVFMFIQCPGVTVMGPVQGSPALPCSEDCGCSERFSPMCAADNVTLFYSPCYAACTALNTLANPVVFSECGCINSTSSTTSWLSSSSASSSSSSFSSTLPSFTANPDEGGGRGGIGVSGYCPDNCESSFYNYLILQVILETVTSTGRVGGGVIIIRAVADEDRGLALGTLAVFTSFLSFIPAPIVTGAIIDSSCLVWEKSCGSTGNCWLYDNDMFRTTIHLVPAVCFIFAALGDLIVFCYSHRMDLYGERSEELQPRQATPASPVTYGPSGTPPSQHQNQQRPEDGLQHPPLLFLPPKHPSQGDHDKSQPVNLSSENI